jgi:broad specificity phosphatase PhoE
MINKEFAIISRMITRFIFVRHGELDGENSTVLHGPRDKVSLSEKGRNTMERACSMLQGVDVIFSSNEIRTKQSAEILSKVISKPIHYLDTLEGRIWGDFAGQTWKSVSSVLDGKSFEERYQFVPPNGESWKQFEERILTSLKIIGNKFEGKTICIISHGSSIRVLLPKVFNIPIAKSLKLYPDYGSISSVEFDGQNYKNPLFNRTNDLI